MPARPVSGEHPSLAFLLVNRRIPCPEHLAGDAAAGRVLLAFPMTGVEQRAKEILAFIHQRGQKAQLATKNQR